MARSGQGRPSKPTRLKVLDGDRPDRINRAEPKPAELAIEPTAELPGDAAEVWSRLAPDLIAKKVLTAWDAEAFTQYCLAVAASRAAWRAMQADGFVVAGQRGGQVKSPHWQLWRDSLDAMIRFGGRFGLTPSDRAALSIGGDRDGDQGAARLLS
jgi:P27 family predicted phage terminase small subunit